MILSPIAPSTSPHTWYRSVVEPKEVRSIRLAILYIVVAGDEAEDLISIQANRAHIVYWLPVRLFMLQSENDVMAVRLDKLVPGFLFLEIILPLQFRAQIFDRLAELNVHHVSGGQLPSECVEKRLGFRNFRLLVRREELLDRLRRGRGLPGGSDGSCGKPKYIGNRTQIHPVTLPVSRSRRAYLPHPLTSKNYRGTGQNFPQPLGTGGGSIARDLHSEKLIG